MLSRRPSFRTASLVALATALAAPGAALADGGHGPPSVEVVAGGLDNPRGLDVGRGAVYVAEAGRGGPGPCLPGPEGGVTCQGATGAVTRIDLTSGVVERLVAGLPSRATQVDDPATPFPDAGTNAIGPSDVTVRGARLLFTVGLQADPARRADLGPLGAATGKLWRYHLRRGGLTEVADLAAYEAAANPDGGEPDSNPNAVAAGAGRRAVVDAGGNSLLAVRRGQVSTLAVFPTTATVPPPFPGAPDPFPVQPVPTSVVMGPDGDWYVGQLAGFPFPAGEAEVYRVPRDGGAPQLVAGGFTTILDLAVGRHGELYVLQATRDGLMAPPSPGVLLRVDRDGHREELAAGTLTFPTGLAIARRHHGDTLYVANRGNEPGTGEVVAVRP